MSIFFGSPIFISTSPASDPYHFTQTSKFRHIRKDQIRILQKVSQTSTSKVKLVHHLLPSFSLGPVETSNSRIHPHERKSFSKHTNPPPCCWQNRRSAGLTPVIQLSDPDRPQNHWNTQIFSTVRTRIHKPRESTTTKSHYTDYVGLLEQTHHTYTSPKQTQQ